MMEQRGHSTPARHPWTSVSEIRGSTWCSFNAPRYAQYAQSGRSMIEMLGVLAVIGVLSVAGIAGYNNAMNRHRANELLYEVQKRAVVVAAQVAQGRESLSISEFTNPSGYLFDVKNWNTTQFAVTLTQDDGANIDAKICDQIKMLTENNLFFQRIGKNCIHFIFNKNLSSADEPTLKKSCTKQSECNGYQQCLNGYCEENCRSDQLFSEKDKTYDCSEIPTTCGICTERQYCKITAHNYIPDTGECVDLESEEEFESKKRTLIFPDGTTKSVWLNASVSISWWSAKNYCEAHGKKMADINTAMALEPKYWTWTSEISNYRGAYAVLERVAKGLERNYSYKALCID